MDDIIRSVDFEFEVAERAAGTGLTLEGYAAVFNTPTFIDSWEGRFEEVILPGSFRATLERSTPKLMFEHGKHPLIGNMPLGTIDHAAEDSRGVHIKASLSDNWLVQPVRDAIRDKAVTGMSFRMVSASIVDKWERRSSGIDLRSISALDCPELGPVVFPAYEPTTVAVRSVLDRLVLPKSVRRGRGADSRAVPDDASFNDVTEAVCDALCAKLGLPEYVYVWIADLSDTWAIYSLGDDYFKIAYSMDDAGAVTFSGDPMAVEQQTAWVADTDDPEPRSATPGGATRISTGQPVARSAGAGDATPGNERAAAAEQEDPNSPLAIRHRMLQLKGVIA